MAGVAVKVTEVPGQTGFSLAAMLILTGMGEPTDMMMLLEVAGFPEAQEVLDVIIT